MATEYLKIRKTPDSGTNITPKKNFFEVRGSQNGYIRENQKKKKKKDFFFNLITLSILSINEVKVN